MADQLTGGAVVDANGVGRCPWAMSTPDYILYHDTEWGVSVHDEQALYERLMLEAFQSGLSWLTILRKRDGFREAFCGFDPDKVAGFTDDDAARLMQDARIVRNRQKIAAAITNARAVIALREHGGLDALVWSFAPPPTPAPDHIHDVPSSTPESIALSKALKTAGFVFVGPTTAYAMMQAIGMVNDHVSGCHRREWNGEAP